MEDTMAVADATGADSELMADGCHFDYLAQVWVDGHDHAHFDGDTSPLRFCGADYASCAGLEKLF